MNSPNDTASSPETAVEPSADPGAAAPARLAPTQPFYWSVRRELWEHRSLYVGPLIVGGLILFGFLLSLNGLPHRRRELLMQDPAVQAATVMLPYHFAAFAMLATLFVVAVVYCLGALHGERRDRSLLFWKSLPVSDLVTVLAKAIVPLAILPAIAFGVSLGVQLGMWLLTGAVLAGGGLTWTPATAIPLARMLVMHLYAFAALSLWWAPAYAWLLLVSGWAKRVPFLWAVLPPLALALVEKIAFDTHHVAALLGDRLAGGVAQAFVTPAHGSPIVGPHHIPVARMSNLDPAGFLSSAGLWLGLVAAAGFLAAAVWMRRRREPI